MPRVHLDQLAAAGRHYRYFSLDTMLQDQALAGYKTIELIGWSPHLLMDENGVLDVREVRRKAEEAELRIGAFVPEAGAYNYRLGQEDPELSGRSRRYFAKACEASLWANRQRPAAAFICGARLRHHPCGEDECLEYSPGVQHPSGACGSSCGS